MMYMPLGKTRLPKVQAVPDSQPSMEGIGLNMGDAGKRTGQVVQGMASFYGNIMNGAVKKIKEKKTAVQEPPFG